MPIMLINYCEPVTTNVDWLSRAVVTCHFNCFLLFFKVWTSIPNEGGPVYFLGPAAAEHPQQALLSHDQWSSVTGTGQFTPMVMRSLIHVRKLNFCFLAPH